MAVYEQENPDKISVYAEFISSLSVANIFVGFQSAPRHLRVRRVTVERKNIIISLTKRTKTGSEDGCDCPEPAQLTLSVPLPNYISILPNTCSSLQPSPLGWQLRMNIEEIADSSIPETKRSLGPFAPRCRACNSHFLASDACISSVLPLSALGLPPGMDFDQMGFTYFCHEHGHHDEEHPEPEEQHARQALFVPKPSEVFVCEAAYILNAEALDFSKLAVSDDSGITCGRCHLALGQNSPKSGAVKLYYDTVRRSPKDDARKMLATFVKDCSRDYCRIRVSLQDSEDTLLLWIMDRNLKTFQASFLVGKTKLLKQQEVCKILYRHEKLDSPFSTKWACDSAVKQITVHESLLTQLLSTLLCSTESLPLAWRQANNFCVGFLNL